MKAKIKKTGEIINVVDYTKIILEACNSYGDPIELSPEEVELIPEKPTEDEHWQEVRERAAIAAMQGLLSNSSKVGNIVDYTMSAVDYADALIKQLKKKSQ